MLMMDSYFLRFSSGHQAGYRLLYDDFAFVHKNNFAHNIIKFTQKMRGNDDEFAPVFFFDDLVFQNFWSQRIQARGRFIQNNDFRVEHKRQHRTYFLGGSRRKGFPFSWGTGFSSKSRSSSVSSSSSGTLRVSLIILMVWPILTFSG